jgi:Tfp pilus assembly protein PilO
MDEEKIANIGKHLASKGPLYLFLLFVFLAGLDFAEFRFMDEGYFNRIKKQEEPLKKQIKTMKEKIAKAKEFLKNEEAVRKRMVDVRTQIEIAQKRLPGQILDAEINQIISKELDLINMRTSGILKPIKEQKFSFYAGKSFKLNAKGSFLQFLVLMERLSKKERIINILDINFKSSDMAGRYLLLDGDIMLETYKFLTDSAK